MPDPNPLGEFIERLESERAAEQRGFRFGHMEGVEARRRLSLALDYEAKAKSLSRSLFFCFLVPAADLLLTGWSRESWLRWACFAGGWIGSVVVRRVSELTTARDIRSGRLVIDPDHVKYRESDRRN